MVNSQQSSLITHYSLLITHYSLVITHYSLLSTHSALITSPLSPHAPCPMSPPIT
ncbi:hypothetical protein [Nostoc sp. CMAA1605]|uniref:hypothetical protein n=1 Tax=Nostoc sp. CMAA1605 TaxID=2055159 RepID=UPI001F183F12|nr:hypothetical protein [Nostoc sp. CMAA1605]